MFGLKSIVGLQELEEQRTILTNFALMAMQCSPEFNKHVTLMSEMSPYLNDNTSEQIQVINEYKKLVEKYKKLVASEDFFLIRTA